MAVTTTAANGQFLSVAGGTINGALTVTGSVSVTGVVRLADGTVSSPGLAFSSDEDTGLYRSGANVVAVAAGGTLCGAFYSNAIQMNAGSAATPGISFIGDENTGLYRPSADAIAIACGGVKHFAFYAGFLELGTTGGTDFQIYRDGNNNSLTVSGMYNSGSQLSLYGSSHASKASDVEFYSSTALVGSYDNSADIWRFSGGFAGGGNVSGGSIATNATYGHMYIPTCAGTPNGTPSGSTGYVPFVFDTTNNKLYVYDAGAWIATGALT